MARKHDVGFQDEYKRLEGLRAEHPEYVNMARAALDVWKDGPLLLYVALAIKQAHEAGLRGEEVGHEAPKPSRARTRVRR